MSGRDRSSRRDILLTATGMGGLLAASAMPAAALADDEKEGDPSGVTGRDEGLTKFAAPRGKEIAAQEGRADSVALADVVRVASHRFEFRRADGDAEEKTVAVDRPDGAGFIVMLMDLQYAFVNSASGTTLRERPLGEFVADIGMRGDNLVCRVRLTDVNADDPVLIRVTAGVLFFN